MIFHAHGTNKESVQASRNVMPVRLAIASGQPLKGGAFGVRSLVWSSGFAVWVFGCFLPKAGARRLRRRGEP